MGQEPKPNILVIMSDEHHADALSPSGNEVINTPHLQSLADGGLIFDNCYCNSPLCVPSRLSFTAGKYISKIGAWNNLSWLPSDSYPSLPHLMNAAGYESVLCGKMHYDKTRNYGFRRIPTRHNSSIKNGRGFRRDPNEQPSPGISERFERFYLGEHSGVLDGDREVTAGALDFFGSRGSDEKPFFMLCGYLSPHFPLIVPEPFWRNYEDRVPMPIIPEGHIESQPRNYRNMRIGFKVDTVPDEIVKKGRELYYGLVEWMDNEIGKVLTALKNSASADNTVVIYTSDHGENMGEHGMWWKNCGYDSASRIPLIVNWPARWAGGKRRTEVCSLVDLAKAIADLGSAEAPEDWDGDSLVPVLDNDAADWKNLAVVEYYSHPISSGYAMVRKGNLKYTYHTPAGENHPSETELYDLDADPGEFYNLASDQANKDACETLHKLMVEELGEEPDETEKRCLADFAKGYDRWSPVYTHLEKS